MLSKIFSANFIKITRMLPNIGGIYTTDSTDIIIIDILVWTNLQQAK